MDVCTLQSCSAALTRATGAPICCAPSARCSGGCRTALARKPATMGSAICLHIDNTGSRIHQQQRRHHRPACRLLARMQRALGDWADSWILQYRSLPLRPRLCLPCPHVTTVPSHGPTKTAPHGCEARADQTTTSDPADQVSPACFARCSTGRDSDDKFLI